MEERLRGIGSRLNHLSDERMAVSSDPNAPPRKRWFNNKGEGNPRAPIRNPEVPSQGDGGANGGEVDMNEMVEAMASLLQHSEEFKHHNLA